MRGEVGMLACVLAWWCHLMAQVKHITDAHHIIVVLSHSLTLSQEAVIRDIDLEIEAGQLVMVVGQVRGRTGVTSSKSSGTEGLATP